MRVFRVIALSACMVFVLTGLAHAQALGQILGVVTDSGGGVLPGVSVTVTGTGLQQPLVAQTTMTGAYTFPKVPIGTYTVTFSLQGFKKAVRKDVLINTGFSAKIDMSLAIGSLEQEVTVSGATPTVDTKKTTTGGTFTGDIILNVPTARDPWQVLNLTPGISLSNVNVGGSASGQQPTLNYAGSSNSVQWNLEGGNITDMSSNSSPAYFNFDSFQEIQVVTGGGDVSVQSAGLFINLVTKSGSNVFKGSVTETFENHAMQGQNVTKAMFDSNTTTTGGFGLSGAPLNRVGNYSGEIGGPIKKNRLWFWAGTDYQDINAGVVNFFKSTPECAGPFTYTQLRQVQDCLANDKTTIQDFNGKVNFQLNSANKFQFLTQTDYKLRNNRGANSTTAPEATTSQYSAGVAHFTNPTYQLTHTWLPSDKLVFTNQYTFLAGGFFLDNHDYKTCGSSTYAAAVAGANLSYKPDNTNICQYNIQPLTNRTTGLATRSISGGTYQTDRPSYELKTDGTYFVSHLGGGDHALKFGVGWRKNPTLSFSHSNGGGNVQLECVGNVAAGCPADGKTIVPAGDPGPGLVPFRATLSRDSLVNYDWQTTFAYLQDSYTRKRMTVNGGLRYDYQWSTFLGGCLAADSTNPLALQGQCQGRTDPKQPFHNVSPRVSATYDLTGKGKTAVHASYSYYFESKRVLANNVSNLGNTVTLTWGSNQNSGLCSTVANASCWNDANHDGFIQIPELLGTPTANTTLYNTTTGVLSVVPPTIDPKLKLQRTREGIIGFDHQVVSNVHTTFDFIYRYNDRQVASYFLPQSGLSDRAAALAQIQAASALWVPTTFTDPNTGLSAPYYTCPVGTCVLPSAGIAAGSGNTLFTTNSNGYSTYKGVQVAIVKRLSNKWQGSLNYTWNDFRGFTPVGSFNTNNTTLGSPQGIQWTSGYTNNTPRYTVKAYGSVELPFGLLAGMNLLVQDGDVRTLSINGPGVVPSALVGNPASTINYTTLTFEPAGNHHLPVKKLLDLNVRKTLKFGRQELAITLDAFNVFNVATTLGYSSGNASNNGVNGSVNSFNSISSIVPPRVFRIDARFSF